MNVISEWINSLLMPGESIEGVLKMNSLNKCVTVKRHDEIQYNFGNTQCKLSIVGCEDSNIYVDSCVETLLVSSCINCIIFVAAVSKVCTIEKCENSTLCVAANLLRIGNCVDTLVHSYTPNSTPIVYGDTRNLRMAPHNAHYAAMLEHIKRANIKFDPTESDWFTEQVNNFKRPNILGKGDRSERGDSSESSAKGSGSFSILATVDFSKMVMP